MTIQNTPTYALPYPQGGDSADGATQLQALCTRLEAVLGPIDAQGKAKDTTIGLQAARPAFGTAGRRYFSTDVVADYVDTGSAWLRVSVAAGVVSSILAAAAPAGWVLADGSAVANAGITADLYAAIGALLPDLRGRFPLGVDGTAGRVASNDTLAAAGGAELITLATAEVPVHAHTGATGIENSSLAHNHGGSTGSMNRNWSHNHYAHNPPINPGDAGWAKTLEQGGGTRGVPFNNAFNGDALAFVDATDTNHEHGFTTNNGGPPAHSHNFTTGNVGGGTPHNNMPPYQCLNWIVKL